MHKMIIAALGLALASTVALAQASYPSRPITMIVPFAAGGSSDVIARIVAEEMGKVLGQRIVAENIPGAGGSAALARLARADADGYTIVIGNSGTNAASYSLYPDLKYTADDFTAIGLVAKTSPMIAVKNDFPAKTLAELIDYAKKNPGKVNLGHAGIGSSNYLICRTFLAAAGIDVQLVSYRGAGPALNDMIGGQIDGVCDAATSLSGTLQGGKARGLVVSTAKRLPNLLDVPTAAEAGLPDFQAQGWNAFFAPKGTSDAVIQKLNAALKTALGNEALRKRFDELSSIPPADDESSPDYVKNLVPAEIAKYKKLLSN
ncbi:MAG: tripartite tricarboxylate transporter substrate-binding protein [Beijerinckiaceae bacterium]